MAIRVSIETPLQDDVRELVEHLNAHMLPLSPLEFQFKMTVEQMAEPETTVFVARDEDGKAVGCGALKMHEDGTGELKRMFTRPEVRGKRVGSALVDAIVGLANAKNV
jgi:putative acetyltransferase